MAWLQIKGADGSERAVPLGERTLRIGRAADSDIMLSDAEKSVSRTHAEVRWEQGRFVIVDLESQNGTWINGERVQRAELPVDGEVAIGTFRLKRMSGDPPGTTAIKMPAEPSAADAGWHNVVIEKSAGSTRASATHQRSSFAGAGVVIVLGIVVIGAVTWRLASSSPATPAPPAVGAEPAVSAPPPPSPPPSTTAPSATPATGAEQNPPAASTPADPPAPAATAPPTPVAPAAASRPVARQPLATQPPVPRKPGESVDAWRNRIAALEARYEYSKAALDRGDYGSAASGFEAILRSEPGFGDAPDLLVQARAGLRKAAEHLIAAGRRLDAAGDWVGALQQYDRAREVDATTPGLESAMKREREQLRGAGHEALDRGLEQERLGHEAEALQEFTKALQWLPADDSSIPVARAHADRLRLLKKE